MHITIQTLGNNGVCVYLRVLTLSQMIAAPECGTTASMAGGSCCSDEGVRGSRRPSLASQLYLPVLHAVNKRHSISVSSTTSQTLLSLLVYFLVHS